MPRVARPAEERFWPKVAMQPDGCWRWVGATQNNGYGVLAMPGRRVVLAHRWSYEHFVGSIPRGLEIDHLCRVRVCVNPAHMEAVTHRENGLRGEGGKARGAQMRAKTHCVHGHEFTPENTRIKRDGNRACRTCNRERPGRHVRPPG